jgi:Flp pilus assembly protein TadG
MSKRRHSRQPSCLSRFLRRDEGATAVEFGFVGIPFFYLLCVIFETGLILFTEYTLENGTAQTARLIRTGQAQTDGMSAAQFKDAICAKIVFLDCASKLFVDVRKYTDFESVSTPSSISTDSDGNSEISDDISVGAQFDMGGPEDVVVVRAYYDWKLFVPGIPGMSSMATLQNSRRLLSASFAFRNEPYTTP